MKSQFTVYFPIRLRQVIQEAAPRVGRYTELGKLRSKSDRDREYQRLLERDNNPFSFLYIGASVLPRSYAFDDICCRLPSGLGGIRIQLSIREAELVVSRSSRQPEQLPLPDVRSRDPFHCATVAPTRRYHRFLPTAMLLAAFLGSSQ